jgi:hypothetical protein
MMPITTHRLDGMTLAKEKEGFIFWAIASAGYLRRSLASRGSAVMSSPEKLFLLQESQFLKYFDTPRNPRFPS